MRHLLDPVDGTDVAKRVEGRAETSVDTENFVVNNGSEGQIVEDLGAVAPNVDTTIFLEAFVVESINLRNLSAFVVSSYQCNTLGVANLQVDVKKRLQKYGLTLRASKRRKVSTE